MYGANKVRQIGKMPRWTAVYICGDPSHRPGHPDGFEYRFTNNGPDVLRRCPQCQTTNFPVREVISEMNHLESLMKSIFS